MKPLRKTYDDFNKLIDEFCTRKKCIKCDGRDENGEPNGYGCVAMEKFYDDNKNLIKIKHYKTY